MKDLFILALAGFTAALLFTVTFLWSSDRRGRVHISPPSALVVAVTMGIIWHRFAPESSGLREMVCYAAACTTGIHAAMWVHARWNHDGRQDR